MKRKVCVSLSLHYCVCVCVCVCVPSTSAWPLLVLLKGTPSKGSSTGPHNGYGIKT